MADKTYKQWADYYYKKFKKQYPESSDSTLKIMANDYAKRSFDNQESAKGAASNAGLAASTLRVGPEAQKMPIPKSDKAQPEVKEVLPPVPSMSSSLAPGGQSYVDRINQRLKATNAVAPSLYPRFSPAELTSDYKNTGLSMPDLVKTFTDTDYIKLKTVLKKLGYKVGNDKGAVNAWLTENLATQTFPSADVLIKDLTKRLIGGGDTTERLPQRQIQKVDRQTLVEFAQGIADEFMFQLDPEKLNKVVNDMEAKANRGALTVTKKVRNPKTGKLELVTETTREFQQATEGEKLRQQIKQEMPGQVELSQGISFINELKSILAGGM